MNKHDQSPVRLRAQAAVASVLLLLTAAWPCVTPAQASVANGRQMQSSFATTDAPDSNPYSNPTQCVYRTWALAAQAGHKLPYFGNAKEWRHEAISASYTVADTVGPEAVHSVAVWGAGVGGAGWAGHVGWVVDVSGDEFLVQDRNWIAYGTDDERWVTWEPGISFIILGSAGPAAATPTPTATATPSPTPAPPTPVPMELATAVPAEAQLLQDAPAGRRVTTSPASRSARGRATAPGEAAAACTASPLPWYRLALYNWSHILSLPADGPEHQPAGPLRCLAVQGARTTLGGGGLSPFPLPGPWPLPTAPEGG